MLEGLERVEVAHTLYRLANLSNYGDFARRKGLSFDQAREIVTFMGRDLVDALLKKPFEQKILLSSATPFGPATRFSDGGWPVFYAALEEPTAERECLHHYAREAMGDANEAVYYSAFRCDFRGESIDLRLKQLEWPDLVAEDYGFCQKLGEQASDSAIDAFLAPSARQVDGTTAPVFLPRGLSNPGVQTTVCFSWDEEAGTPVIQRTAE